MTNDQRDLALTVLAALAKGAQEQIKHLKTTAIKESAAGVVVANCVVGIQFERLHAMLQSAITTLNEANPSAVPDSVK
jgi:hypothetical protein